MTKKDYIKLAQAFAGVNPMGRYSDVKNALRTSEQWHRDVAAVADVLAADNPRFDRERFTKATEA